MQNTFNTQNKKFRVIVNTKHSEMIDTYVSQIKNNSLKNNPKVEKRQEIKNQINKDKDTKMKQFSLSYMKGLKKKQIMRKKQYSQI